MSRSVNQTVEVEEKSRFTNRIVQGEETIRRANQTVKSEELGRGMNQIVEVEEKSQITNQTVEIEEKMKKANQSAEEEKVLQNTNQSAEEQEISQNTNQPRFPGSKLQRWKYLTLQQKLTAMFALTAAFILTVNLYMFSITNEMAGKVEEVYVSNVSLNELSGGLDRVQKSLEEYLNTKSSDAMEDYYRSDQAYREMIGRLNAQVTDNGLLLMEKNIRGLSESYLVLAADAVQAKRGRNVERYGTLYEDASLLYEEIHTFIYSLNNEQFKDNSRNYQVLMDSFRYMEMISMGILLLVMLGNISLIVVSTKSVTHPLRRLAQAATEVAGGNFDIGRIPVTSMDEVGTVTNTFNQMVENIRNYIERFRLTMERENQLKERELMMQSHLKDAQLKYLQAQINPHFLFNTLNAGAQLAMMEDAERTEQFLANVAEFFRYNVRKNDKDAALREEIHLVDNYVYILNVRFSGEILFTKDVDESLLEVRVPSMILQPLVENAFNYGIRNIGREGRIELSVYRKKKEICISIWDNGIGIEKERIGQILSGHIPEDERRPGSNGVGMKNVMERLRLYFREQARFEIFSEGPDTGAEVLITIPADDLAGAACGACRYRIDLVCKEKVK